MQVNHEFYKENLVKPRQIAIIFKNLVYQQVSLVVAELLTKSTKEKSVFLSVLNANPDATKVKMNDGWLPLHVALKRKASSDVIKMLVEAYSEAVKVKNKEGNLPFHYALHWEADPDVIEMLLCTYQKLVIETIFASFLYLSTEDF
jgi:ankyrin repeat protein